MKKQSQRFLLNLIFILIISSLSIQVYSNWESRTVNSAAELHSVFFINNLTGFVGGKSDLGGLFLSRTTNGGNNWTAIFNYSGSGSYIEYIFFKDANTGWCGGNGLYVTTNGGLNWTSSNLPVGSAITSISFPDPNIGVGWYARGSSGTVRYIGYSVNWGFDWTQPYPQTSNHAKSVFFLNLNTGFVSGNSGLYMKTTNGGANWTTQNLDSRNNYRILFVSSNIGYMAASEGIFRKTTDGGTTWANATVVGLNLYGLSFPNSTTGYTCTHSYGIYKTTNSGSNWREMLYLPGPGNLNFQDIHFINAFTGFCVGGSSSPSRYAFLRTTDGGEIVPSVPQNLTATSVSSSQINLSWTDVSNNEDGFRIWTSPDGINNWLVIDSVGIDVTTYQNSGLCGSTPYYYRVQAYNIVGYSSYSNVAFAVTQPGAPAVPALVSPANGSTISSFTPTLDWNDVNCATSYGLQVSNNINFTTTIINQTGLTSSQYTIPSGLLQNNMTYYWRSNATRSSQTSSWSIVWSFLISISPPPAPVLVSPSNGVTGISLTPLIDWTDVSGALNYGVQVSTDSVFVTTVINQTGLATSQYQIPSGMLLNNTKYYWRANATNAGGTGVWSTVWNFRTALVGVSIYNNVIPKEFKLYDNYPNPFNPITKIRFDIPQRTSGKIKIYDILGKVVAQLVDEVLEPGSYEIDWVASNYPSGVYFYKFEAMKYIDIKKMILIK